MPFVPLGSRKRIEVILDDDKERLGGEMRAKDNATVKLHYQVAAGSSGYRYANNPTNHGPVRGPPAPFKDANKPWAPPDIEPNGMAAMRDLDQAPIGGIIAGSHSMIGETLRKTRSVPALVRTMASNPVEVGGKSLGEQAKEAANPISIELNRWKRLAEVTNRDLLSMPQLAPPQKRPPPDTKPKYTGGLVNFPKYMLFENSHLKSQEFQRFVEGEDQKRREFEERQAALDEALARGEVEASPASTSREVDSHVATASWGQPRRGPPGTMKNFYAGNPMPSGKCSKSSNPFRMG